VWHREKVLQYCVSVLYYTIVLRYCIAVLYNHTLLQHYNIILQCFITVKQIFNAVFYYIIILQ